MRTDCQVGRLALPAAKLGQHRAAWKDSQRFSMASAKYFTARVHGGALLQSKAQTRVFGFQDIWLNRI